MYLILFGFLAIVLFYLWVKKRFNYWTNKGYTSVTGSFPFGSMSGVAIKSTMAEILDSYYKNYKQKTQILGLYNFLSPVVLVIDPELIKNILVRDFQSFYARGFFHNKKDDPVGANIFTLDGKEWKDRRVNITPLFTSGKTKLMFEIININSNRLVDAVKHSLSDSSTQEMKKWSQRYTSDNIGNVAFGIDCNSINDVDSKFMKYGKRFFELSSWETIKLTFASEFPEIGRKLGFRFAPKVVGDFFLETFLQTIKERESMNLNRKDFVSMLLGLKDLYSPTELASEAFLIFLGGFETSSTLMTFILYELALNQDIQKRLREEVLDKLMSNDMKLTYDLLMEMKYLDMVTNEALRKYPPAPTIFRKAVADYEIPDSKLFIPKGTSVFINCYSLQRDPQYFPEPEKFDPERFSAENINNIKMYTYFPFGEGPRFCLGMRFGLIQSKIGIANLVKSFIFTPSSETTNPLKFIPSPPIIFAPVGGMKLNVKSV